MAGIEVKLLLVGLGRSLIAIVWLATALVMQSWPVLLLLLVLLGAAMVRNRHLSSRTSYDQHLFSVLAAGSGLLIPPAFFLVTAHIPAGPLATALLIMVTLESLLLVFLPLTRARLQATAITGLIHLVILVASSPNLPLLGLALLFFATNILFWRHLEASNFPVHSMPFRLTNTEKRRLRRARPGQTGRHHLTGIMPALPLVALMVMLGGIIFLVTPRFRIDFSALRFTWWSEAKSNDLPLEGTDNTPDGPPLTGFSEVINLNHPGLVEEDSTPVMRVDCLDEVGQPRPGKTAIYLRGMAFNNYHQGRWQVTARGGIIADPSDGQQDGWILLGSVNHAAPRLWRQKICLLRPETKVVFAIPQVRAFQQLFVRQDGNNNFFFTMPVRPNYSYLVDSWDNYPGRNQLNKIKGPADLPAWSLVPPGMERVRALSRSIVHPTSNDQGNPPSLLQTVKRIESHLKFNYDYSLYQPPLAGRDPVLDFLFRHRLGSCQLFASAMVLLLRSQAIPSRIVNGFHTSEAGPTPGSFLVRNQHAHTWVEVHFPGHGWQTFDPTPPVGNRINYPPTTTAATLGETAGQGEGNPVFLSRFLAFDPRNQWGWYNLASWFLPLLGGALTIYMVLRNRQKKRPVAVITLPTISSNGTRKERGPIEQYLHLLAKKGFTRGRSETLSEVSARAGDTLPKEIIDSLSRQLCAYLYGGKEMDRGARRTLKTILKKLS